MPTTFTPPQPLYHAKAIRRLEAHFSAGAKPSLMERAGAAAAKLALEIVRNRPGPVLILAGPGNNGGDAFVLARRLREANREVEVCFIGEVARLSEDAILAITAYGQAGGEVHSVLPAKRRDYALAVDGLFGIGLARPVGGQFAEWIDFINHLPCPVLALDVPSGLNADTGQVLGTAVRASHTATFIAAKPGLYSADGPDYAGQVSVFNLGLDVDTALPPEGATISPLLFEKFLLPRPRNSHKGNFGTVGIIGGATGMVGAAILAGRAALQTGAGRVFAGLLDTNALRLDLTQPELMFKEAGALAVWPAATCLAVGPGLGTSDSARDVLLRCLHGALPLVLDADALNLLAADPALQRQCAYRPGVSIATPHPLEASRLLNCRRDEVQEDRIEAAQEIARRLRAWTVLKGAGSVVAAPDGRWWLNTTGNPGMSTAGMGDVLCGLVISLLGQGWQAEQALLAAVHLHGAAADLCVAEGLGPIGLTASDIIPAARRLLNSWIARS